MKTNDDKWMNLLAAAAPTFAGEATPPFGFVTSTMARLRSEGGTVAEMERIGWRALMASLAALAVAMALAVVVNLERPDLEPGVNSLIQVENIPVS